MAITICFKIINRSAPSGPLPFGFQPQPFGETRAPRKDKQKRVASDSQGAVGLFTLEIGVGDLAGLDPMTGPVVGFSHSNE